MKIIILCFLAILLAACAGEQDGSNRSTDSLGSTATPSPQTPTPQPSSSQTPSNELTHKLRSQTGANLDYLEYVPPNVNDPAPLILFHHGSGATGRALNSVECCGLPAMMNAGEYDSSMPFIVLAPQRLSGLDTEAIDAFLSFALLEYPVDPERIYFIGWSQGANLSSRYVHELPARVSAAVLLAGGFFQGVPTDVCNAGEIPIWGIAGGEDTSFITQTTSITTQAFGECGGDMRYTLFPDADHLEAANWPFQINDSRPFEGDDPYSLNVYEWLLSH